MGAKLNEKKSFRKKFLKTLGYRMRLSSFLEIFENALPFATVSRWKFKPKVSVEWSVHYVEKIPIHQFPVDHNYIMHLFTLENLA